MCSNIYNSIKIMLFWILILTAIQSAQPKSIMAESTIAESGTYQAEYVSQQIPDSLLSSGETLDVRFYYRNTGTATWHRDVVKLGTEAPKDRASSFYRHGAYGWHGAARIYMAESSVEPGETATFRATLTAPSIARTYREEFRLVAEDIQWFEDSNSIWFQTTVEEPGADLRINRLVATRRDTNAVLNSGDSVPTGTSVNISVYTINCGSVAVDNFYLEYKQNGFFIDDDYQNDTISADCLDEVFENDTFTVWATGKQTIEVCVDSTLIINETDEANNCSHVIINVGALPDLIVDNLSLSKGSVVPDNSSISIGIDIKNCGELDITTDFILDYFDNDQKIRSHTVRNDVNGGCSHTQSESMLHKISGVGTHEIKVCLDTTNLVTESNEDNNCETVEIRADGPVPTVVPTQVPTLTPTRIPTQTPVPTLIPTTQPTPVPLEGDIDGNGAVNIADFALLRTAFLNCEGSDDYDGRADLNGDGCVTIDDFTILRNNFGTSNHE